MPQFLKFRNLSGDKAYNEIMLQTLLKILFPSPCLSCGILSQALCEACFERLVFSPHTRELDGLRVYCGMVYQTHSILEGLIHPFKYKHQASIFRLFVPHMREALKLLKEPKELILVPVPLHPKRQRERGYNQSELLAHWVARSLGCRMVNALERVKETKQQAQTASKMDRQSNMQNAFVLKQDLPRDGQIVLVDDIVTTGSTLLACLDALKQAGVHEVSALTLANREKNPNHPWN